MVESCGCLRHSPDIRMISVCYQKRRGRADTCGYQGDRWLLSEMISLRHRVNVALCGRNGRRRRVRCHVAASVPHPCRIPQRVASSPAVSCPCRVRVASRGTASVSYPTAPRPCRIATPCPCRIPPRHVRRIRVAARRAASVSQPAAPLRSPPRLLASTPLRRTLNEDQKCRHTRRDPLNATRATADVRPGRGRRRRPSVRASGRPRACCHAWSARGAVGQRAEVGPRRPHRPGRAVRRRRLSVAPARGGNPGGSKGGTGATRSPVSGG